MLVDNGYHAWANTVPPFSNTAFRDEIRWSEWLESMRKDVECRFGIMKGRWRILKTGVRLHKVQSVDMIWATCCALHNMLFEVDGFDEPWDGVCIPTSNGMVILASWRRKTFLLPCVGCYLPGKSVPMILRLLAALPSHHLTKEMMMKVRAMEDNQFGKYAC